MKKIRCPKCGDFIVFDETTPGPDGKIAIECNACGAEFGLKMKPAAPEEKEYGRITIVENVFCYKQEFPLHLGDNIIGRENKGMERVDIPVETSDPSMDKTHCTVNVSLSPDDHTPIYHIKDNDSITGTQVMNDFLQDGESRLVEGDTIITLGATTVILTPKE